MSETSDRLSLPYLMPAQAQKHVTVNEALRALDALVQTRVLSRAVNAEPSSPEAGDAYVLPAGPDGSAWDGFAEHDLVAFQDGAWARFPPRVGWRAYIADEDRLAVFDGTAWRTLDELIETLQNLSLLGIGTTADAANPFSARLNAALWTALETGAGGTGDLRYTLNKEAAGNVLSLLFQSGWSGRAEMGLIGSENFAIKMSTDGASFIEALTVTGSGKVGINTASPTDVLHIKNDGEIKTRIQVENDLSSTNGQAQIQARSDAANFFILSHGSGITLNRWGAGLAGWNEFLSFSGNGLALGSFGAQPMRLGTDSTTRLFLSGSGEIGVGTDTPTEALDIDADALRLRQSRTPASATAAGEPGTISRDGDYLYICVAANAWKRAALSSW